MESIEIKNFGPIKHVKLDLRDINVFIGPTASGKSTVAKLVAIFKTSHSEKRSIDQFVALTADYNIDFNITEKTFIKYSYYDYYWEINKKEIVTNQDERSGLDFLGTNVNQTVYIPAERNLLATIGQSIFGLMSNNVAIPMMVKHFGARFEYARKRVKQLSIDFLK